jgi:geranylgeranyl diphosphate synthase type II
MTSATLELQRASTSHFFAYRDKIEQEIARSLIGFGEATKLKEACEYALRSGGKRLRPLLVLLVAEGLGHELNVYPAALSVEFFHTASLIVDDLPCMDDEEERRGKPSLHKEFGETIALLSSYSLICAAFEKIHENAEVMAQSELPFASHADAVCRMALAAASQAAGIRGATGGQFLDLSPPNFSLETIRDIVARKTATLFEVSFLFGWLFGGGDWSLIPQVRKMAAHFGFAFQIADDIGDLAQDEKNQRSINLARQIGKQRALGTFEEEMRRFEKLLKELSLDTASFQKMTEIVYKLARKNAEL